MNILNYWSLKKSGMEYQVIAAGERESAQLACSVAPITPRPSLRNLAPDFHTCVQSFDRAGVSTCLNCCFYNVRLYTVRIMIIIMTWPIADGRFRVSGL